MISIDEQRETDTEIHSRYIYRQNICKKDGNKLNITKKTSIINFKTDKKKCKLGVMLVGLGGNNGITFLSGIIANKNKITWKTKKGVKHANYLGSITQSTCIQVGIDDNLNPVNVPFKSVIPLVEPDDIIVSGWDISKVPLNEAMERSQVLDIDLQNKLSKYLSDMPAPLPGVYYPDFIASNQSERADNVLSGANKLDHLHKVSKDIKQFKETHGLDKVVVLWTANTEKMVELQKDVHYEPDDIMNAVSNNSKFISPSMIYALAAIKEECVFLNGSPQNTIVPAIIKMAENKGSFIGGSDFKSGQTKIKSMLSDFFISTGIKVNAVSSYNHLGNNDGLNLSSDPQFKSKEISKSSVMTDSQLSNPILYSSPDDDIEQCVVIKYIKETGDTKIAMDEWINQIFMSGEQRLVTYATGEDSLLAVPLMYDMVLLAELLTRVKYTNIRNTQYKSLPSIMKLLSFCFKAPLNDKNNTCNVMYKQLNNLCKFVLILNGLDTSDIVMEDFI